MILIMASKSSDMRANEMGNQSTSGMVLEEEKPVAEVPEEGSFEAGGDDKEMKGGEIGEIPEDQTETTPFSNNVSDVAGKAQESEVSEPVASVESANQEEEYIEKPNSEFDPQIQEQYSIKIENDDRELDESDFSNSVAESVVQDSNPDEDSTAASEETQHLSLLESAEAKILHESSHMQDPDIDTEDKIADLVPEVSVLEQDKPSESNVISKIPEPEQKQFVQAEEMMLASAKSENGENQPDSEQASNVTILKDSEGNSSKQEEHTDIDIPKEDDQLIIGGSEHPSTLEDADEHDNLNEENLITNNEPNETPPTLPRISTDSNPAILHLRKSPSFEFGIPLDARSEESDQTPLLVRDRSLARSISGTKFHGTMIPPDYNYVEEKTIRMERSTSDISRDSSFINFLKKDADLDTPPELQEMALTSVKGSGKQKARASFFSACICCSAAIH